MASAETIYRAQVQEEVDKIPAEYLAPLLQILRAYRESVTLLPANESFRQGWREAMEGDIHPVEDLWSGLADD
ncbi:MAG: hypothetical protein U0822_23725 [Anaerolineae bacterium]